MTAAAIPPAAAFARVDDLPGQPAALVLLDRAGVPLGSLVLGPADALAVACDLLATARLRFGRAPVVAPPAGTGDSPMRAGTMPALDQPGSASANPGGVRTLPEAIR